MSSSFVVRRHFKILCIAMAVAVFFSLLGLVVLARAEVPNHPGGTALYNRIAADKQRLAEKQTSLKEQKKTYSDKKLDKINKQLADVDSRLILVQQNISSIQTEKDSSSQQNSSDVQQIQNTQNEPGGPLGQVRDTLHNIADSIDGIFTAMRNAGIKDEDINRALREANFDPRQLAGEVRNMGDQIQAMNLDGLRRWRDQLEAERAKSQKQKDDINAKAKSERDDLASKDAEIARREAEKDHFDSERDRHNSEADRIARECPWWKWPVCAAQISWEKTQANGNQTYAWTTATEIARVQALRIFPDAVVKINDITASPYEAAANFFQAQRDSVDKTIADIEQQIRAKKDAAEREQAKLDKKRQDLEVRQNDLKNKQADLQQQKNDLESKKLALEQLQKEIDDLKNQIQSDKDHLNELRKNCPKATVPAGDWKATYYESLDLSGSPILVFFYGHDPKMFGHQDNQALEKLDSCGLPLTHFSARFTRKFNTGGTYAFAFNGKGGFKLYVDNVIKMEDSSSVTRSQDMVAIFSTSPAVRVDYFTISSTLPIFDFSWDLVAPLAKSATTTTSIKSPTLSAPKPKPTSVTAPTYTPPKIEESKTPSCPAGSTYSYTLRQCLEDNPQKKSPYDGLPCPPEGFVPSYSTTGCIPQ